MSTLNPKKKYICRMRDDTGFTEEAKFRTPKQMADAVAKAGPGHTLCMGALARSLGAEDLHGKPDAASEDDAQPEDPTP